MHQCNTSLDTTGLSCTLSPLWPRPRHGSAPSRKSSNLWYLRGLRLLWSSSKSNYKKKKQTLWYTNTFTTNTFTNTQVSWKMYFKKTDRLKAMAPNGAFGEKKNAAFINSFILCPYCPMATSLGQTCCISICWNQIGGTFSSTYSKTKIQLLKTKQVQDDKTHAPFWVDVVVLNLTLQKGWI